MEKTIDLVTDPIEERWVAPPARSTSGATLEFRGIVRDDEAGNPIAALRYEAYESMARREIARILEAEAVAHRCERVTVIHRHGWIPVGEMAILFWVESRHRGEGIALLARFMDRLKQDVPIWKVEARPR